MSGRYSAFDIANYFLWKAQDQNQELLSNLKLQKLIYYAQGLHLVLFNNRLFKDKIEAWNYGPVVPIVYHYYKDYGSGGIPSSPKFDPTKIDKKTKEFLDEVYDVFGQFSAIRLMEIAHSDKCWEETKLGKEITPESMRQCLKKYLKDG